ncbi:WXG100 family type VII secretion target [Nocardioides sp. Kera G14]|uniref:WXG100 family type VII secretion target n=1 Tax=Nocardioides sp. Kera G14 TaxID=2884264 RepID=UPI001D1024DE|nr:WXG100 family type VII secretion target [Nocardioides sp. Kera G14]UDY23705.1 WXG100 family type VII secretion target [Nocardioides sp. Kera G14]
MSDRILVNHAALEEAVATLGRAVAATEARLSQLDHDLTPLHTDWYGQAQVAWHTAQAQWRAAEEEMHGVLAELGSRLSAAQAAYQAADQAGARAFQ